MRRRHAAVLGLVLAVGSVTPARAVVPDAGSGRRIEVVAAFYPLAEAARRVGGRHVHVIDVTPPGAEPHDLELTTDQVDHIQDADLVIVLGHGFQPAVEKAARDRGGPTLIARNHLRGDVTDDPHVWLDPARMRGIVDAVQGALTRIVPAHATAFARNAVAFDRELSDLDVDYGLGLARCERTLLVTAHEAFGYLATRYGLEQRGIVGLSPDAEPDPKRLAELTDLVERDGVTTVFTEKLVSPKVADTLAREAGGLKTEVLDPLEGLTEQERARGADYVSVMRDNLRKLRTALACS